MELMILVAILHGNVGSEVGKCSQKSEKKWRTPKIAVIILKFQQFVLSIQQYVQKIQMDWQTVYTLIRLLRQTVYTLIRLLW